MGIPWVNGCVPNRTLGASEVAEMHATRDAAAQVQDKTVITLVRPPPLRAFQ